MVHIQKTQADNVPVRIDVEQVEPARVGEPLLQVRDLAVSVKRYKGGYPAVQGVSFDLDRAESIALVGESGSGKTVTASAIAGLTAPNLISSGSARFGGRELIGMPRSDRRLIAGRRIGFIFQEPMSALHPILTIGQQIEEALKAHFDWPAAKRRSRVQELLGMVGLGGERDIAGSRVGQLSGGMRQRAMIAMAISCDPDLLIADEPTTALDVTLQQQVMSLLRSLQERLGLALVLITHDLAVVSQTCQRAAVMYAGQVVELGTTQEVLQNPRHSYTRALIAAIPRLGDTRRRLPTVADTAADLRDERQMPPEQRTPSALVEVNPGHWVREGAAQPTSSADSPKRAS